jgi:hypothetical protein
MARPLPYSCIDQDLTIVHAYFVFHTDDLTAPRAAVLEAIRNQDVTDPGYAAVRLGCGVEWTAAGLPKVGRTFRVENGDIIPMHTIGPADGSYTLGRQITAVCDVRTETIRVSGDVTADVVSGATAVECWACPYDVDNDLVVFAFDWSVGVSPDATSEVSLWPVYVDSQAEAVQTFDAHGRRNEKTWRDANAFRYRGYWRSLNIVPRSGTVDGKRYSMKAYRRIPGEVDAVIASSHCNVSGQFVA